MSNRRNARIKKKKATIESLGTTPQALPILLNLARENPGQPLRHFIRAKCKEVLAANSDRPDLVVEVREILDLLTESRLRKQRLLAARKTKPTAPFSIPREFLGHFKWAYRITKQGEIRWQLNQM
jgi:hypothetical protein